MVTARQYKFGQLIYDSRNLTRIDENKQFALLRTGKTAVLDFLRVKFPQTKHEGNSFHIDVISTTVSLKNIKRESNVEHFSYRSE